MTRLRRQISLAASFLLAASVAFAMNETQKPDTLGNAKELKEVIVTGFGADRNLKAPEMGRDRSWDSRSC